MKVEHVKGNTWVLIDWEYIPFYKVDEKHCILLDTGTHEQREDLENTLLGLGLTPVGILGSHAHIDHMGSFGYLQQKYGATLALTLGEAGQIYSHIGLHLQYNNLALEEFPKFPELYTAPCLPDRIILPHEDEVELCGVKFDIIRTPGHTVDHICVRTPDNVLYLGDAMMTGRTLHRSKFPYAFDVQTYLNSLGKLRLAEADRFIVAHQGVYDEILPFIDLELRFITTRMLELLDLVPAGGYTTPKLMTQAMCQKYRIHSDSVRTMAYYESAGGIYIHYLVGQGYLESYVEDDQIRYRLTQLAKDRDKLKDDGLPKAGLFGQITTDYYSGN